MLSDFPTTMQGVTPPPRAQQLLQKLSSEGAASDAERCLEATSPSGFLTPRKMSPRPDDEAQEENALQPKTKHTFLHFHSPLKTVVVSSPPRTCPKGFAPQALFDDLQEAFAESPVHFAAASSPTLVSSWAASGGVQCASSRLPHPPVEEANPSSAQPAPVSKQLRLADFLPDDIGVGIPAASAYITDMLASSDYSTTPMPAPTTAMPAQSAPLSFSSCWSGYDGSAQSMMSSIPMFPGVPQAQQPAVSGLDAVAAASSGFMLGAGCSPLSPPLPRADQGYDMEYFQHLAKLGIIPQETNKHVVTLPEPTLDTMKAAAAAAMAAAVATGNSLSTCFQVATAAALAAAVQQQQLQQQQPQQQPQQVLNAQLPQMQFVQPPQEMQLQPHQQWVQPQQMPPQP